MAGPYQALAYFAEKEKGEATRRAIAQQFMEFRRLNPEATADDLRQFLSMSSGGSPYVPGQLQSGQYIERIAQQNGETKAKRLLEEEHKKVLLQAQESGVMEKAFGEALDLTGGDIEAAKRAVGARFGNDPYMMDIFKQRVDPKGVANKWKTGKFEASREIITAAVDKGMSVEQVNALVDPALADHDYTKALIKQRDEKKARDDEERQYTLSKRDADAKAAERQEEDRIRTIATTIASGNTPYELAITSWPKADVDKAMPLVRQLMGRKAELGYKAEVGGVRDTATKLGKQQVDGLNLKALTSKGGALEAKPGVALAGQDIAYNYFLNKDQYVRLRQALQSGVAGKTAGEIRANLWKAIVTNPDGSKGEMPLGMVPYLSSQAQRRYEATRPANFQQALANQDASQQKEFKRLSDALATALALKDEFRIEALTNVYVEASQKAEAVESAFLSARSTEWGDTAYDETLARQAADRWRVQFEQLAARAGDQEAGSSARAKPAAAKPKIAPRGPQLIGGRDYAQPGWKLARDIVTNPGDVEDPFGQPGWKTIKQLLTKPTE